MSNTPVAHGHDEILHFAEELAEVKELVREASRQLLRIERRIKATFPGAIPSRSRGGRAGLVGRPRLDDTAAEQLIVDLKARILRGEQVENQLRDYSVKPELQKIARILGMTNAKLPPKDELVRRISTRLRQSVSVTTGIQGERALTVKSSG